jgi:hypothetical protein
MPKRGHAVLWPSVLDHEPQQEERSSNRPSSSPCDQWSEIWSKRLGTPARLQKLQVRICAVTSIETIHHRLLACIQAFETCAFLFVTPFFKKPTFKFDFGRLSRGALHRLIKREGQ